jgi:hypothetical protein
MRESSPVHGPEAEPASGPASRQLTARPPAFESLRLETAAQTDLLRVIISTSWNFIFSVTVLPASL